MSGLDWAAAALSAGAVAGISETVRAIARDTYQSAVSLIRHRRRRPSTPGTGSGRAGTSEIVLEAGHPRGVERHRIGLVPAIVSSYQDRDIKRRLNTCAAGTQILVGLGGSGKTQLAAAYAECAWRRTDIDLLVWVNARSRASISATYAEALESVASGGLAGAVDAQRFLAWLATAECRWLIVLDDLQDPRDIRGLWPPTQSEGQVVVTTRRHDATLADHGRELMEVGPFHRTESLSFLGARLDHDVQPGAELDRLAAILGDLPLALAQAAAYMLDRGLSPHDYHARLVDADASLDDLLPDPAGLPDDQALPAHATWRLSRQLADDLPPSGMAGPLLDLTAMLDPNGIPMSVFTAPAALSYLTTCVGRRDAVDPDDARDALHCLHRLSLITIDKSRDHVFVHGLVQRAARNELDEHRRHEVVRVAAECLRQIWPPIETDRRNAQSLRDNVTALLAHGEQYLWLPEPHPILARVGDSLVDAGLNQAAASYFTRRHVGAARYLGPTHRATLAMRSNSAHWTTITENTVAAIGALTEVLDLQRRTFGLDDPDSLLTRYRLVCWQHGSAPRSAERRIVVNQLLDDQVRVLGQDHPMTLKTVSKQITLTQWDGDIAATRQALEKLVSRTTHALGPGHRQTFGARSQLASWLGSVGKFDAATQELQQLLCDQVSVLGAHHSDTLATRGNLALWRGRGGEVDWALDTEHELMLLRLRLNGPDHDDTLTSRNNYAHWLGQHGEPAEAVRVLRQLLVHRTSIQGANHPHIFGNRYNIAHWIGEAGDPAQAASLLESVFADRRRSPVVHRVATMNTCREIAHWLARAGDKAGTVDALTVLLDQQTRFFGPHHSKSVHTASELALIQSDSVDPEFSLPASAWPYHAAITG